MKSTITKLFDSKELLTDILSELYSAQRQTDSKLHGEDLSKLIGGIYTLINIIDDLEATQNDGDDNDS